MPRRGSIRLSVLRFLARLPQQMPVVLGDNLFIDCQLRHEPLPSMPG